MFLGKIPTCILPDGQYHRHLEGMLILTGCGNLPTVGQCHRLCDGKPDPVSAGLGASGWVHSIEPVKQTWELFLFYEVRRIKYLQPDGVLMRL